MDCGDGVGHDDPGIGRKKLGKASGIAIGIGTLGAVGALATGLVDYTDTDPPEDSVALTHGVINLTAALLFTGSFLLRMKNGWRTKPALVALSTLGYAAVTAGGFLGGSLVFRRGVMVNRNAYRSKPNEFTRAIALEDLPVNHPTRVEVKGEPIVLIRRDNGVFALGAVCSHYGAPMQEGKLDLDFIECPWHYSRYSISDGSVLQGPTSAPLPMYDTEVRDGSVYVKLEADI